MPYANLQPIELWHQFAALNGIPRPSGREGAARDYVLKLAAAWKLDAAVDGRGNTVVRVPATPGAESVPPVAIQAHLDMVCEKRPEVEHDFLTDPILPRTEGEWVSATGTTLGADNGIGAAAALALVSAPGVAHPALELIFTVEEETGLHGAAALDPALVSARRLINLDSEDPRELTIGCAGGAGTILRLPVRREPVPSGWVDLTVTVSGLKGGHSGVQIHEPLANAIKLLALVLRDAALSGVEYRLAEIHGGNAHNAIPRDASALLVLPEERLATLEAVIRRAAASLAGEWPSEPGLTLEQGGGNGVGISVDGPGTERLVTLLNDLPHGVLRMSDLYPGKVETSSNLAMIRTSEAEVEIATSSRSFSDEALDATQGRIAEIGRAAGAALEVRDGYGGWQPDPDSQLLKIAARAFERSFGTPPEIQVIHAGLECGVLVRKLPGMEAISFGPRIEGAHTPEERVSIPTVAATWQLLTALLADLAHDA
jgi:dipeptidase D